LSGQGDGELIDACRGGDRNAYGLLVDRYYRRVFGICFGILGNAADAEDAAQEIFTKGFLGLDRLQDGNQFGSWIAQIARNHCIDVLRRRKQVREVSLEPSVPAAGPADCPRDLEGAIRRLPLELRMPLVMYYFDGHNAAHIAAELGMSHSCVCQRLRAARSELHRLLTEGDGS
jgi:RNA polymerase sigma-70 factor, ECF subfamily